MPDTRVRLGPQRRASPASLATLDAMARLAGQTSSAVHVIVAREPGVVEHARAVAHQAGVAISVDLRAYSVRVRFGGR